MSNSMYSILQMGFMTFFGGPFAGIYSLKKNFDALENEKASIVMILCAVLCALIFPLVVLYWSDEVSKLVIPLFFTFVTCVTAFVFQFKNWDRDVYVANKSFGNVVLVILFSWIMSFACFFLAFFTLHLLGVNIDR